MSKIFEALQKTDGELANLALPMVTDGSAKPGGDNGAQGIMHETESVVSEMPPVEIAEEVSHPAVSSALEWETASADGSHNGAGNAQGIPAVAIRLSVDSPVLPFDTEHSQAAEQYRIVRTKLLYHPRQPRLIVISSASSGDGKTITSINLAGAMALKSEAQVLLVDADLRKAQVADLLGIQESPGLTDVLAGQAKLEDAIVRLAQFPNLFVLPGGKPQANPTELLDSSRWAELCDSVRQQFKFVIFDAPPIAAVADYDLIQAHCDGVVLVVRPDHTDRKLCTRALTIVPKEQQLGVLINCVRDSIFWKTRDYYYSRRET